MLAKKFRLPIQTILRSHFKSYRGESFLFKRKASDLPYSRFGLIISSKVEKNAAHRSKLKRLIFNFIRLKNLHLIPRHDFLIIVLGSIKNKRKDKIEKELGEFLI